MKKFLFGFLGLALFALGLMMLPSPRADAQSSGQGTITGTITNATKDAKPSSTANLDVVLVTVPQGATSMLTTTVKSDANGKFVFSNLDTISTTRYFVTTNYGEVDYFSDLLVFESPLSTTLVANFPIYESTEDASVVKVAQTHIVIGVQAPWLEIQQIIALENTSDRVYIGKPLAGPHRATLTLPVLPKAIDVQFDDPNIGQTVLIGDTVLTYTLPIGPGRDQIVYQYAVPFTPPAYDFNLNLPFSTDKFGLYVLEVPDAKVESQQLKPVSNPMGNTPGAPQFISMAGENLQAGTTVQAKLSNLPTTTSSSGTAPTTAATDNTQTIGLVVLGFALVAAVALLAIPLVRRRQAAQMVAAELKNERLELLQDIADLDDEFEAGKLSEEEYKAERARLKAQLLELEQ